MIARVPILILLLSFVGLWLSMRLGAFVRMKQGSLAGDERTDFNVILGATLTLLGLIIGFSFSMALSRYDQRKNFEAAEANAIGTAYMRLNLLPDDTAAKARASMKKYLDLRIRFYEARDWSQLEQINRDTEQLQNEVWDKLRGEASRQPAAVATLVLSGLNNVWDAQGFTQAAWWNRIPFGAWSLMTVIAVFGGALIGNGAHSRRSLLFPLFSLVIALAFFFVADLDNPRAGLVRVVPKNLVILADSLK